MENGKWKMERKIKVIRRLELRGTSRHTLPDPSGGQVCSDEVRNEFETSEQALTYPLVLYFISIIQYLNYGKGCDILSKVLLN
jgi:hypothetical protein